MRTVTQHRAETCLNSNCGVLWADPSAHAHLAHYKNFDHVFVRYRSKNFTLEGFDDRILRYASKLVHGYVRIYFF